VAKKATKKATKKVAKKNKCGSCGEFGHNARSCPEKIDSPSSETIPKEASPPLAPEEVFDLASVKTAASMKDAPEPAGAVSSVTVAEAPEEPPKVDPSTIPPGLKLKIPKRKKKLSKAEESFWAATTKKLAPDSLAEAGELTLDIPRLSSGCFGTDVALYDGIPQGRFIRITGLPKSAKTGWCLNTVAEYQANHCSECFQRKCSCKNRDVPQVLWIDIEHRIDSMLRWVQGHGVNLDCLRVLGPPTGQDVIDMVDHIIRSAPQAKIGLIVIDSIAHITSQDEIKKATKDGITIGRNAMLMNSGWRKWTSAFHSLGINNPRKPTILCINQIRHKVGVNYGSPETMPGGMGQGYASTVDIRFSAGAPNFMIWKPAKVEEKKKDPTFEGAWVVKQKAYGSTFKPKPDQTPDFITINYRVTASGHCPAGRSGEFNYWLKSAHGHRCGDVDNGLQLWTYCKRYKLIEVEGVIKKLFGHEARTFDALETAFRADPRAQRKAWVKLMGMLRE
jgi:RecA/RadA recombinase